LEDAVGSSPSVEYAGEVTSVNVLIVAGSNVTVAVLPVAEINIPLDCARLSENPCELLLSIVPDGVAIDEIVFWKLDKFAESVIVLPVALV
jgi:hypothetical protein